MTERVDESSTSAPAPLTARDATHLTPGAMLRQARESHGLNLEVVAAALKVPPQKLRALESDDIAALPDPVFARALAASVCRALRVDPAPVLAKLPGAPRDGLAQADRVMSGNIRDRTERRSARGNGSLPKPVLVLVGLLLAGAAALYWVPQQVFDQLGAAFARWTSRDTSGAVASAGAEPPSAPAAAPGTVVESVALATSALPAAGTVVPSAVVAEPLTAAPAVVSTPPVSAELVTFSARSDTWITVTEMGGKVLYKQTLKLGETVALSGAAPLAVVVGRAAGVDVRVRGQVFDLAPVTKPGGVARFEVN